MNEFNENGTKTIFGIGNPLLDIQAKDSGFIFLIFDWKRPAICMTSLWPGILQVTLRR